MNCGIYIVLLIGYSNAGFTKIVEHSNLLNCGLSVARDVFKHTCPLECGRCLLRCGYNLHTKQDNECVSCAIRCGACAGALTVTPNLGPIIWLATEAAKLKYVRKTCVYECIECALSCITGDDIECEFCLDECYECAEKHSKRIQKVAEKIERLYAYTKAEMTSTGESTALDLSNKALKVTALPAKLDKLERMHQKNMRAMETINEAISKMKPVLLLPQ